MVIPNFEQCLIAPTGAILEAMQAINRTDARIALVTDADRRLLGTVTDGDVRRGLLRGLQLSAPVSEVMNLAPKSVRSGEDRGRILDLVQRNICRQFPVLDDGGRVIGIEAFDDAVLSLKRENWIVVLAGGRGTRLLPLTAERPKPMLHVGNQPILATIVGNLARQGFVNIFISLNYRGEMIKSYFGDGSNWGVNIRYLMEDSSLGTAGALSLLPEKPRVPVIVTNGDILTTVDFNHLLDFHRTHGAVGTMCISEYSYQVPFGVVDIKGHTIASITEKPLQRFLISAGIYVLQPEAIDLVPHGVSHDMPDLFGRLIADGRETCVFPIGEYWTDIGRVEDLERANRDFSGHFPHVIENPE